MKLFVLLLTWQLASSATIKSACKVAQITDAGALLMDGGESQYSDAVAVSCNPHVTVARSSCIVAAGITIAGNCRESGFRDGPRLYSRFQNIAVFASYTRGDTMFALTDASGMLRLGTDLNVASRPTDATISALAVGVSHALEMVVFSIDEQGRGSIVRFSASASIVIPYGCSICAWSGRYFYVLDVGGSVRIVRPNGNIDARVFAPPFLQTSGVIIAALFVDIMLGVWGIDGDGWHRFLFNDDACARCPPGMYAINGQCAPCRLGSVAPVEGAVACMACDVGQFSNIEGTACISADAADSGEAAAFEDTALVFTVGRVPHWMCAPAAIVGSSKNNTIWVACTSGDVVVVVGNSTSRLIGALPFSVRCSIAITRDESVVVGHCGEFMARITSLTHTTRWFSGGVGEMCIAIMTNSQNEAEDTIFWKLSGRLMAVPALYDAGSSVDQPRLIDWSVFAFLPHPETGMVVLGYDDSVNRTIVFRLHANFIMAPTMMNMALTQSASCCWDYSYVDAVGHVIQTLDFKTLAGGEAGHVDDVGTMARLTGPMILAKRVIVD